MAKLSSYTGPFLLLMGVVMGAARPAIAKPPDPSQYPLRVHIFQTHWDKSGSYVGQGDGIANLYDGTTIHGINFVYQCPIKYAESVGTQAYEARWKKPEKTIELIGSRVGDSAKVNSCEFKITLHDYVYDVQNGTLSMYTQEQYKIRMGATLPPSGSVDTNPAHYPLRLAVLQVDWESPLNAAQTGTGRGNLRVANAIFSVDFTASCSASFAATPEDKYYAAIWVHGGSELAVLLSSQGGATLCTLKTNLHTDVYLRDASGGIKAVSLEEYKALNPNR